MIHYLQLKNSDVRAKIDASVFEELARDTRLKEMNFFGSLRRHSSGCVVFQKTFKKELPEIGYRTETIYLHKLIAERCLPMPKDSRANLVGARNGNKLDCRLENLVYRTRATASRKRTSCSKTGYTGVYLENNRYRAVIFLNKQSVHLGMFSTPEEAALAYNRKSLEYFGEEGKINAIRSYAS